MSTNVEILYMQRYILKHQKWQVSNHRNCLKEKKNKYIYIIIMYDTKIKMDILLEAKTDTKNQNKT